MLERLICIGFLLYVNKNSELMNEAQTRFNKIDAKLRDAFVASICERPLY